MRKILLALVALLLVGQVLRPTLNEGPAAPTENDLFVRHPAPPEIETAVKAACYDCHSNRTRYPWYAHVQPIAWWVQDHVVEAKDELNFSEFGRYPAKRAAHKLHESVDVVNTDEMPLPSYRWMHADARWTSEQKEAFARWAESIARVYELQGVPKP